MISGYVVISSAVRSQDIYQFLKKRIIRIYPTLLLATLTTFASVLIGVKRKLSFEDYFTSLLLVDPRIVELFTGHSVRLIDPVI